MNKHLRTILLIGALCTACNLLSGTPIETTAPPTMTATSLPPTAPPTITAPATTTAAPTEAATQTPVANTIEYDNTRYGFRLTLPASWTGYSVVTSSWNGNVIDTNATGLPPLQGPLLLVRHPLWTEARLRQDIPIQVFTLAQWDALQRQLFAVSAAPIGPAELGRNDRYVFALPPRYNYAFLPGWEEIEQIMQSAPLHAP